MLKIPFITMGNNWIRIGNLQACWGGADAASGKETAKFTYPQPFVENPTVLATHTWTYENKGHVTIAAINLDSVDIFIYEDTANISNDRSARVIAVGRWK